MNLYIRNVVINLKGDKSSENTSGRKSKRGNRTPKVNKPFSEDRFSDNSISKNSRVRTPKKKHKRKPHFLRADTGSGELFESGPQNPKTFGQQNNLVKNKILSKDKSSLAYLLGRNNMQTTNGFR